MSLRAERVRIPLKRKIKLLNRKYYIWIHGHKIEFIGRLSKWKKFCCYLAGWKVRKIVP